MAPTMRVRRDPCFTPITTLLVVWAQPYGLKEGASEKSSRVDSERHPRDTQALGEHGAHGRGGSEHARAGGQPVAVERQAERALAHHHRGGGVAWVARGGDGRHAARAVDLHPEVAACPRLLARALTRVGQDAVEQLAGLAERQAAASAPSP